jgi:uncharacterized protein YtpQ (UPF0354 family)
MLFLTKLFTKDGIDGRESLFPQYRLFNEAKSHIYPWVKVTYPFDRDNCQSSVRQLFEGENMPICRFWQDDLCIFYTVERGNRYEFLLQKDLPKGMPVDALHELAIANLDRDIRYELGKAHFGGYALIGDRGHDSAFITLPHVWKEICDELNDHLIVGIPSKNQVLIAAEQDLDSIANMKIHIHDYFKKGDRLLTRNVFRVDRCTLEWTLEDKVGRAFKRPLLQRQS